MLARQPLPGSATRKQFDRLAAALQQRYGPHARALEPGHWVFEVMTDGRRSQVVHLLFKNAPEHGEDAARLVTVSPIGALPPRYNLEELLRRNATLDVGAICIEDFRNEDGELETFLTLRASHLILTADFAEAWEMIEKVARVADELELDIHAQDVH